MLTIWKFGLRNGLQNELLMPRGATVLDVQLQYGTPCVWALVDPDAERESRHFELVGTGWTTTEEDQERRVYIGTYQHPPQVWHVFECKER